MTALTLDKFVSLSKKKKKVILDRVAVFANKEQLKLVEKFAGDKKK